MYGVYCTTGRLKSVCRSEIWPVHEVGNLTKGVQHTHHYSTLSDPVNIRFVRRQRSEVTSQNLCLRWLQTYRQTDRANSYKFMIIK
jgi:hypothetical protein